MTLTQFFKPNKGFKYTCSDKNIFIISEPEFIMINLETGKLIKNKSKIKTICQSLGLELNQTFRIYSNGKEIYSEQSFKNYWYLEHYDYENKYVYYQNYKGFWEKIYYNSNGKKYMSEDSNGGKIHYL